MKYTKLFYVALFCIFIFRDTTFAQTSACTNSDFSLGNFTNWTGSYGDNVENMSGIGTYSNITAGMIVGTTNSLPSTSGRQTLMTQPGTDPNTNNLLSVLPPGGGYSVRLGNDLCSGCSSTNIPYGYPANEKAQRLTYTFTVNNTNNIFTYQYAVVLQDPGSSHTVGEKPKFNIYVLDTLGAIVDSVCGMYEVVAAGSIPGFQSCLPATGVCSNTDDVKWKDWTSVSIDVSAYMGHKVSIQFTTYDCTLGGHFGYAYLSCFCGSLQLSQQCSGSSDIVSAPSGFGTYLWSTGATTSSITLPIPPNNYGDSVSVVCTSVTGCAVTLYTFLAFQPPTFYITPPTPKVCQGSPVSLTANTVSGSSYTYTWSPGGQTGQTISVSPMHTTIYTVTGSSGGGCSNSATVTVTVDSAINAKAIPDTNLCKGHNVTLDASGSTGLPTLVYNWSNGYNGPTQTITPTSTTTYTVTVTNSGLCKDTAMVTVHVYTAPTATLNHTDIICNGDLTGTASITPTSGFPPYTYLWSNSGNTSSISNVAAGTYTVTLTDGGGCDTTFTVIITQPTLVVPSAVVNSNVLCNGGSNGSATASATGGTPPYTYLWDTGTTSSTVNILDANIHTVTVTDHNGCSKTTTVTITQPTLLSISLTADSVKCFGDNTGSITATPSGGTPSYIYTWSNGPHSATDAGLYAGTYYVTVADANGCSSISSSQVFQPTELTSFIDITGTDTVLKCHGDGNGEITIYVVGGTPPFIYHWNTGAYGMTINNLSGGTYTDTIIDHNGCKNIHTVHVYEPSPLFVQLDSIDVQCKGDCNGQLTSAVTGATPWHNGSNIYYHYLWSTGDTTKTITALCPNIYSLTVTDSNGCKRAVSASVGISNIVTANFTAAPTTGYVPLLVNFIYTGTADTANTYTWTFGDGNISHLENPTNTYTTQDTFMVCLTVKAGVCIDSICSYVYPESPSTLIVPNVFTPNSDGHNDEFLVKYTNIETFDCIIFNRWGKKMYEWNDVSKGWDGKDASGKLASDGVYFYIMTAKGYDGVSYSQHGYVTLIK